MSFTISHPPLARFRSGDVLADAIVPTTSRGLVRDIVLVFFGVALVAFAAQVRIPLGFTPVPLTGQTFAVLLAGASLGPTRAALALTLYVVAGIAGAPVFTGGSAGMDHLLGPSGGYLIGFIAAAALLGWLARRRTDRSMLSAAGSMLAASLVIYAFGVAGLMIATGIGLARGLELGVYPFIIGDMLKAGLAAIILPAAWEAVGRMERRADHSEPAS